jgi:coenzyme F420-dependent oxidoreductase
VTRNVTLPVAAQPSLDAIAEQARRAEELGYGRVWLPETWGRDAITVLATIAERTESIGVGASVLPIYSRSPAILGQSAATLQELSGGRFRLGLGPSGPIVIEKWHGVPYERPLRYTRETVEVVKAVLSGEVVEYDGDFFELTGFRLRCDAPDPAPAVDVSGMGPKAVELAGRFADGWHAIMLTRDGMADRIEDLERGAELGDRDPDGLRVMRTLGCCALPDGGRARHLARQHLAFYVGAMGTFYRDSLIRQGYEDVAHEIADSWAEGDREAAMAAISDELLDDVAAAGTPERARELLAEWEAIDGVDAVSVSFPRGANLEEIDETLEALAP